MLEKMTILSFLVVFMGEPFVLCPDVPLAQPDAHAFQGSAVDAVSRRDDPPVWDEASPTADPLAQEALFDEGHLPGVTPELGVLATHDPEAARPHAAALCNTKQHIFIGQIIKVT